MIEHKIGNIFNHKDVTLKVETVKKETCIGCYFYTIDMRCPDNNAGHCSAKFRTDHKNVIFKQININNEN